MRLVSPLRPTTATPKTKLPRATCARVFLETFPHRLQPRPVILFAVHQQVCKPSRSVAPVVASHMGMGEAHTTPVIASDTGAARAEACAKAVIRATLYLAGRPNKDERT